MNKSKFPLECRIPCDKRTGLHGTSFPLIFNIHAIESKRVMKAASHLFLDIIFPMFFLFSRLETPAYFISRSKAWSVDGFGLSFQCMSIGFSFMWMKIALFFKYFVMVLIELTLCKRGSYPNLVLSANLFFIHCMIGLFANWQMS